MDPLLFIAAVLGVLITLAYWPTTTSSRLRKAVYFIGTLAVVIGAALFPSWYEHKYPCDHGYTICARVSELILAGSSAKTALSAGMQANHSWSADWMRWITIAPNDRVASATISSAGQIIVHGSAQTSGSVITMAPTITTDYKLVWSCAGSPAKYMPVSCRTS
jgi:type IV pilus assembly protein PilA